jgi:hypothetical protein
MNVSFFGFNGPPYGGGNSGSFSFTFECKEQGCGSPNRTDIVYDAVEGLLLSDKDGAGPAEGDPPGTSCTWRIRCPLQDCGLYMSVVMRTRGSMDKLVVSTAGGQLLGSYSSTESIPNRHFFADNLTEVWINYTVAPVLQNGSASLLQADGFTLNYTWLESAMTIPSASTPSPNNNKNGQNAANDSGDVAANRNMIIGVSTGAGIVVLLVVVVALIAVLGRKRFLGSRLEEAGEKSSKGLTDTELIASGDGKVKVSEEKSPAEDGNQERRQDSQSVDSAEPTILPDRAADNTSRGTDTLPKGVGDGSWPK